ncbi:MAG: putative 2OG-Fe(II) oxygenase [Planctomycetales bacterium]
MEVTDYHFFPTRVVSIQFPDTGSLNAELCDLLEHRPELDDRSNLEPEAMNLVRLAETVPAIEQLRSMFLTGAKQWLKAEGIEGPEGIDLLLFSNRMGRGESTIVHNHPADLIGIYYARTAESDRPPIPPADGEDYFDPGDGVLLLHDPRFNANLTTVCTRDHIKVFPRPGLMLIFPAYVWHSVTPHRGDFHRLAFSMNFKLRWPADASEYQSLK